MFRENRCGHAVCPHVRGFWASPWDGPPVGLKCSWGEFLSNRLIWVPCSPFGKILFLRGTHIVLGR